MSSGSTKDYDNLKSFVCLLIIIVFAIIGRIIIVMLGGYRFPKFFHKYNLIRIKPIFTKFKLPHLLGEILFGILARNAFADLMEDYNPKWGQYCRMICLSVLLLGGGMHLDLKGKGLVVLLLVMFAPTMEAIVIGLLGLAIFSMKIALGLALGFTISAASPAVLVPPMIQLQCEGYGIEKGIPTALIASASLQDVSVIICFGICSAIALNDIKKEADPLGKIAAGIGGGLILGYLMYFLKKIPIKIKFIITIVIAITMVLSFELSGLHESKYLSIITFGFICRQVWGIDRPDHYINILFRYMTPFLFGTVGASMVFADLQGSNVGYAILIIFIGAITRYGSTIIATLQKKFTWKERIFMGFAWLPKATVQAALGGYILEKAQNENNEEYIDYGNKILTTAIFGILLTAPPGAIATLTLGQKLLTQRKISILENDGGYIINEQEEQLIQEAIFQEFPGVEIDDTIKTVFQQSFTKSHMRRQRLRNLVQDPNQPNQHFILTTYQNPLLTEQQQAIIEENEFGIDISNQNRPRIKSGEFKKSTAEQESESIKTNQKQKSRRNSLVSLSRRSSHGSISSIALSVGDANDQQLDQIHQINKKWREQKIQHMENLNNNNIINISDSSDSYDTWERSIDDQLENQKVSDINSEQQSSKFQEQKFQEHQISDLRQFNELEHQLQPNCQILKNESSEAEISSENIGEIQNYGTNKLSKNPHLNQ